MRVGIDEAAWRGYRGLVARLCSRGCSTGPGPVVSPVCERDGGAASLAAWLIALGVARLKGLSDGARRLGCATVTFVCEPALPGTPAGGDDVATGARSAPRHCCCPLLLCERPMCTTVIVQCFLDVEPCSSLSWLMRLRALFMFFRENRIACLVCVQAFSEQDHQLPLIRPPRPTVIMTTVVPCELLWGARPQVGFGPGTRTAGYLERHFET